MKAYRARTFLQESGIGLSELVRVCGRSKTTWSRFLAGGPVPATGDAKRDVERLLRSKRIQVPDNLWHREKQRVLEARAARRARPIADQGELDMQAQSLSGDARKQWKLFASPFDAEALETPQGGDRLSDLYMSLPHKVMLARLVQAYTKAGFVAIYGEPGSGKSTLNARAYRDANEVAPIVLVTPANVERRKLTAVHVAGEIIRQLSTESVPRQSNIRDALAAEILRNRYEQGQRVALMIDEAHELPESTIKDLKRYHELTHGFAKLLAIVLIGQTELATRFNDASNYKLREVIIRCQLMRLAPMVGEVAGYLEKRFAWVGVELKDVFSRKAVDAMEARLGVHSQQYPVLVGNVAVAAMNIAARRGNDLVQPSDVDEVWSSSPDKLSEMGL